MIDVIFSKRAATPRQPDTRPVPSDCCPKQLRAVSAGGMDGEDYCGDEPDGLGGAGIDLRQFEGELIRNRLSEIATLVRALTYGEMMELAQGIWQIRPDGTIDQQSLPMMLHLWSMSTEGDAAKGKPAQAKKTEQ